MTGTLINAGTIIAGSIIGIILKDLIPTRVSKRIMQAVGLCTIIIGFNMVQESQNIFFLLFSLVFGAIVGETLKIEERLELLGRKLEDRFKRVQDNFSKGFVAASLLFCVGPMAILGSIEDGLTGDYSLLLAKSIMDGVSAIAFASTLGSGVLFSAIPVFIYQGGISLVAGAARQLATPLVIAELNAAGGALIIGLSLNILEVGNIKVANLLPALAVPFLAGLFFLG